MFTCDALYDDVSYLPFEYLKKEIYDQSHSGTSAFYIVNHEPFRKQFKVWKPNLRGPWTDLMQQIPIWRGKEIIVILNSTPMCKVLK